MSHPTSRLGVAAILLATAGILAPVQAQEQPAPEASVQIKSDRGLTEDRPYTVFYPPVLEVVDDGSETTVMTLRHPQAPLQCDVMIVDGAPAGWTADNALATLDRSVIEASWLTDFPGFRLTSQGIQQFQSGPALLYEGEAQGSPLGLPVHIVHAEAVDGERTYAVECLVESSVAADARPMVDFILANFSTRSDGECCKDPKAN